ncbi:hypothetical protein CSC81_17905, partial [Tenacibaculum discolor]
KKHKNKKKKQTTRHKQIITKTVQYKSTWKTTKKISIVNKQNNNNKRYITKTQQKTDRHSTKQIKKQKTRMKKK